MVIMSKRMIFLVCIASGFLYVRLFPNLMKEMEEYKGIKTSKFDNFKIQEMTSKMMQTLRKKGNKMSDKSYIPTIAFTYKSYPCY